MIAIKILVGSCTCRYCCDPHSNITIAITWPHSTALRQCSARRSTVLKRTALAAVRVAAANGVSAPPPGSAARRWRAELKSTAFGLARGGGGASPRKPFLPLSITMGLLAIHRLEQHGHGSGAGGGGTLHLVHHTKTAGGCFDDNMKRFEGQYTRSMRYGIVNRVTVFHDDLGGGAGGGGGGVPEVAAELRACIIFYYYYYYHNHQQVL